MSITETVAGTGRTDPGTETGVTTTTVVAIVTTVVTAIVTTNVTVIVTTVMTAAVDPGRTLVTETETTAGPDRGTGQTGTTDQALETLTETTGDQTLETEAIGITAGRIHETGATTMVGPGTTLVRKVDHVTAHALTTSQKTVRSSCGPGNIRTAATRT